MAVIPCARLSVSMKIKELSVAKKSKRRASKLTVVHDEESGTVRVKTNGASLVLDIKTQTITLKGANVVIAGTGGKGWITVGDILQMLLEHKHLYQAPQGSEVLTSGPKFPP